MENKFASIKEELHYLEPVRIEKALSIIALMNSAKELSQPLEQTKIARLINRAKKLEKMQSEPAMIVEFYKIKASFNKLLNTIR